MLAPILDSQNRMDDNDNTLQSDLSLNEQTTRSIHINAIMIFNSCSFNYKSDYSETSKYFRIWEFSSQQCSSHKMFVLQYVNSKYGIYVIKFRRSLYLCGLWEVIIKQK